MLNRLDEADEVARDLVAGAPSADLEYAALRGQLLVERARGSFVDAHALMERAARPQAPLLTSDAACGARPRLPIFLAASATQNPESVLHEVLVEARAADDLASECVALQSLGMVAMLAGHLADSQAYLTQAMTLFDTGHIPPATFALAAAHAARVQPPRAG